MKDFWAPAGRIAGSRALFFGLGGLVVSMVCAALSGWHAHGLLHFGPAPANAWWVFAVEYLAIWLVPGAIFYGLGAWLSTSRVRAVDVFGTTAFALLPLAVMNLFQLLPGVGEIWSNFSADFWGGVANANRGGAADLGAMFETMTRPLFWIDVVISLAVIVLMVIWLFGAVRVSCNLRGWRLWTTYLAGVLIGDAICRTVMMAIYKYFYALSAG